MIFNNPSYLWAFLGLLLPVAIHLWSKKEGRTIKIGSIQLLSESDPKKTSNIKLNELFLLLVRVMLISILVLILAEPLLKKNSNTSPITYLIESSLLDDGTMASILDTLPHNAQVNLLQPGFPELNRTELPKNSQTTPNYWQLLNEMEELASDSIVVFTSAYVSGVKGKRPEVSKKINWIILDPAVTKDELVQANWNGGDVNLTWVQSNYRYLSFVKENIPKNSDRIKTNLGNDNITILVNGNEKNIEISPVDTIRVLIVTSENFKNETEYLQSSYSAIAKYLDRPVNIQVINEDLFTNSGIFNTVVWLSDSPAPKTSGNTLIYKQDSLVNTLIEKGISAKEFYLTNRLNSENVIEEDLPEQLLALLDVNQKLQEKIPQYDQRVMNLEALQPTYSAGAPGREKLETTDISKYLWLLFLILLVAERGLAFYRKQ